MTPITVPPGVNDANPASIGGRMPEGWNRVRIEVADDSQKSRGGHDQIAFEFSGKHGSVRHWLVLSNSPKAYPFIRRDLEACGVEFPIESLNANALVGNTLDVLIEHEDKVNKDGDPRTYAVVKAMRAAEGEDPTPARATSPAPAVATTATPPSPAYMNEDDIPF